MRLQRSGLDRVEICSLSFLFQMSSMTTSKYRVASGGISPAKGAAVRTEPLRWDRHRASGCLGLLGSSRAPGSRTPHSWVPC